MTLNDTLKHNPERTTNKCEESRTLLRGVYVCVGRKGGLGGVFQNHHAESIQGMAILL